MIRRKSGRSTGSMRAVAASAGCRSVPIEGFLYQSDPLDMPPMTACAAHRAPTPPPGFLKGRKLGRAAGARGTIEARSRDDRARLLSEVFGHVVTAQDLEIAFSGSSRGGARAEARTMRVYKSGVSDPDYIDVSIEFEIRIGSHSGKMVRRFFREKRTGNVIAFHELFDLDESTPKELGQGVGESITRSAIIWYVKHGVSEIRTHAAWVGRYVWATFGFNWADAEEQHTKIRELAEYLEEHEDAFDVSRGATLQGQFKVPSGGAGIRTIAQGVSKTAWTLASLHLPGAEDDPLFEGFRNPSLDMYQVGKLFLIGLKNRRDPRLYVRGEEGASDWEGAMILKPGHPTFERARVRLKL